MRLSKSKVLMYLDCPLKFKLVVINNLPFSSIAMSRGSYFHDVLEKFFNRLYYDSMHPGKFEDVLIGIMGDNYLEYADWMYNFIEMETERFNSVPKYHYRPKQKEIKLYDTVNNISGVIDRIDYEPRAGRYTLWDYKTGTVTSLKKHMFEMALYAHLFKMTYPGKANPQVGIYCLKNKRRFLTSISDEQMKKAVEIVNWTHGQVNAENYFPNEKANCYWCPDNVKKICKEVKK